MDSRQECIGRAVRISADASIWNELLDRRPAKTARGSAIAHTVNNTCPSEAFTPIIAHQGLSPAYCS